MSNVEKVCEICSKSFSVWLSRAGTAKTCSQVCGGKLTAKRYADARVKKVCPVCSTEFSVPKCHAQRSVCCSIKCANKMPDRKRSSGKDHYFWNGGQSEHSDGYLYVRTENHPFSGNAEYVLEHRVVMEKRMREKEPGHHFLVEHQGLLYLRPEILVHHINEIKRDNRIENLIACTNAAHRSIHAGKLPVQGDSWPETEGLISFVPYKVACVCRTCGTTFLKKRSDVAKGSGKFCNRSCYKKSMQK